MPIYPLLKNEAFDPDAVRTIGAAFEDVLIELGLKDRNDPVVQLVAKRIIRLAQEGERDPTRLKARALEAIRG